MFKTVFKIVFKTVFKNRVQTAFKTVFKTVSGADKTFGLRNKDGKFRGVWTEDLEPAAIDCTRPLAVRRTI